MMMSCITVIQANIDTLYSKHLGTKNAPTGRYMVKSPRSHGRVAIHVHVVQALVIHRGSGI